MYSLRLILVCIWHVEFYIFTCESNDVLCTTLPVLNFQNDLVASVNGYPANLQLLTTIIVRNAKCNEKLFAESAQPSNPIRLLQLQLVCCSAWLLYVVGFKNCFSETANVYSEDSAIWRLWVWIKPALGSEETVSEFISFAQSRELLGPGPSQVLMFDGRRVSLFGDRVSDDGYQTILDKMSARSEFRT